MKSLKIISVFTFLVLVVGNCDNSDNGTAPPSGDTIETKKVEVELDIPDDSPMDAQNLLVNSALGCGSVTGDSKSSVDVPVTDKYQFLMASASSGKAVLLGYLDPSGSGKVDLSSQSTAKSLILMNPLFNRTSSTQKLDILTKMGLHTDFSKLKGFIDDLLINDPEGTLDYTKHPRIYEEATKITIDILKDYGGGSGTEPSDNKVWIEDAAGDSIAFKNPGSIYYAAGIYKSGSSEPEDVYLIDSKLDFLSYNPGWPPSISTSTTRSAYNLGDGSFEVKITKGFDFSDGVVSALDWDKPEGKATRANLGKAILQIIEMSAGYKFDVLPQSLDLTVTNSKLLDLQDAMQQKDGWKVTDAVTDIILDNVDNVSKWLWGDASNDAAKDFMNQTQEILKNQAAVVKIVAAGDSDLNKSTPFFYDLAAATPKSKFFIEQSQGSLTTNSENQPPEPPTILSAPNIGSTNSSVSFMATTTDPEGDSIAFRFYWGDGEISDWSSYKTSGDYISIMYAYSTGGTYYVTIEAMDIYGTISQPSQIHEIMIIPEGSILYDDFNDDSPGGHPSDPPWTIRWADPGYIRINSDIHYGSSGNSCGFHDYDPDIGDQSDTGYAQIYTSTEYSVSGSVEFVWRVETAEDDFGLRSWSFDGSEWELGYYVLFQDGALKYAWYDENSSAQVWEQIMPITPSTWYQMKLEYDCTQHSYDIYVDGILKVSSAPLFASPDSLNVLQIVAFSDDQCQAAYIDNVNLSAGAQKAKIISESPQASKQIKRSRPMAAPRE